MFCTSLTSNANNLYVKLNISESNNCECKSHLRPTLTINNKQIGDDTHAIIFLQNTLSDY